MIFRLAMLFGLFLTLKPIFYTILFLNSLVEWCFVLLLVTDICFEYSAIFIYYFSGLRFISLLIIVKNGKCLAIFHIIFLS